MRIYKIAVIAGIVLGTGLAACTQKKDPEWRPATESVVYEVCHADWSNQPCVLRKTGEQEVYLYRAGHVPQEADLLWVEGDGRWRVVVK